MPSGDTLSVSGASTILPTFTEALCPLGLGSVPENLTVVTVAAAELEGRVAEHNNYGHCFYHFSFDFMFDVLRYIACLLKL